MSPLDGTGPDELGINKLFQRIRQPDARTEPIQEVILATNWTTEGQATALYLTQHLEMFEVAVTRIAYGIPVGGDLEYIDEVTLAKALEGRRKA